ncbi:MAG: hypothetical protein P8Y27_11155 [Chromatiaceae bacterium]
MKGLVGWEGAVIRRVRAVAKVSRTPGWQDLGLVGGGLAGTFRGRRVGIVVGDAQRGAVDAEGDAVMLQAIKQRIDEGLALEQLVPVRVVEVLCTVRSYADKAI